MENKESNTRGERRNIKYRFLDIVDLSILLRLSAQTTNRYVSEKRVPAYRIANGKYLISVDHLKKHIENNAR